MGQIIGGIVAVYLLLRLWQWILKKLPASWTVRLIISALAAYATAIVIGAYGFADGGPPAFDISAMVYLIPAVIAGLLEAVRLYRNAAKATPTETDT